MAYTKTLASFIADTVGALHRCEAEHNDWADKHEQRLKYIQEHLLPSGSGIDSGTQIDLHESTEDKLVLHTSYHHMNDGGYYDGWTEHTIIVRPAFDGVKLSIRGRDRNDIKDHLYEIFRDALMQTDSYDETRGHSGHYRAAWYWRTEDSDEAKALQETLIYAPARAEYNKTHKE